MQPQYITLGKNAIDLTNQRFGRLTALGPIGRNPRSQIRWSCICDCGNIVSIMADGLRSKITQSCGCLKRERAAKAHTTHGMYGHKNYNTWSNMIDRCTNPKSKSYPGYGGRGITVYDEWKNSMESFVDHIAKLPHCGEDGYSLDRINNDLGYFPGNVQWSTRIEQSRNTRQNLMLTHNGKTQCVTAWAKELGVKKSMICHRIRRGWSIEQALSTPPGVKRSIH